MRLRTLRKLTLLGATVKDPEPFDIKDHQGLPDVAWFRIVPTIEDLKKSAVEFERLIKVERRKIRLLRSEDWTMRLMIRLSRHNYETHIYSMIARKFNSLFLSKYIAKYPITEKYLLPYVTPEYGDSFNFARNFALKDNISPAYARLAVYYNTVLPSFQRETTAYFPKMDHSIPIEFYIFILYLFIFDSRDPVPYNRTSILVSETYDFVKEFLACKQFRPYVFFDDLSKRNIGFIFLLRLYKDFYHYPFHLFDYTPRLYTTKSILVKCSEILLEGYLKVLFPDFTVTNKYHFLSIFDYDPYQVRFTKNTIKNRKHQVLFAAYFRYQFRVNTNRFRLCFSMFNRFITKRPIRWERFLIRSYFDTVVTNGNIYTNYSSGYENYRALKFDSAFQKSRKVILLYEPDHVKYFSDIKLQLLKRFARSNVVTRSSFLGKFPGLATHLCPSDRRESLANKYSKAKTSEECLILPRELVYKCVCTCKRFLTEANGSHGFERSKLVNYLDENSLNVEARFFELPFSVFKKVACHCNKNFVEVLEELNFFGAMYGLVARPIIYQEAQENMPQGYFYYGGIEGSFLERSPGSVGSGPLFLEQEKENKVNKAKRFLYGQYKRFSLSKRKATLISEIEEYKKASQDRINSIELYMIIRQTIHNFFVTVLTVSGKTVFSRSVGCFGFKGPRKRTIQATEVLGTRVGEKLKSLKIRSLGLVVRTRPTSPLVAFLRNFRRAFPDVSFVFARVPRSHNGMRRRKTRRK